VLAEEIRENGSDFVPLVHFLPGTSTLCPCLQCSPPVPMPFVPNNKQSRGI
jgi:hypothetical protein